MISQRKLDEWKKLADEATPGPWAVDKINDECTIWGPHGSGFALWGATRKIPDSDGKMDGPIVVTSDGEYVGSDRAVQNAAFICAARSAVPLLIKEINQLRKEIRESSPK